jgi:hypothetical protein
MINYHTQMQSSSVLLQNIAHWLSKANCWTLACTHDNIMEANQLCLGELQLHMVWRTDTMLTLHNPCSPFGHLDFR